MSLIFFFEDLYAFGIGAYGAVSSGNYEWTYHIDESENPKKKSNLFTVGFGLIVDTNLAKDKLFNNRFQIGYSVIGINDSNESGINGKKYSISYCFGFGIFRNELIRFWVGPQLGSGIINGEYLPSHIGKEVYDFDAIFFSCGGAAGFNLNIGDFFTLGIDMGIRGIKCWGLASMDRTSTPEQIGVTGTGYEGFIGVCFLLRVNDVYRE